MKWHSVHSVVYCLLFFFIFIPKEKKKKKEYFFSYLLIHYDDYFQLILHHQCKIKKKKKNFFSKKKKKKKRFCPKKKIVTKKRIIRQCFFFFSWNYLCQRWQSFLLGLPPCTHSRLSTVSLRGDQSEATSTQAHLYPIYLRPKQFNFRNKRKNILLLLLFCNFVTILVKFT